MERLVGVLASLGGVLARLGGVLARLGGVLGAPGAVLDRLGAVLGRSWARLGAVPPFRAAMVRGLGGPGEGWGRGKTTPQRDL